MSGPTTSFLSKLRSEAPYFNPLRSAYEAVTSRKALSVRFAAAPTWWGWSTDSGTTFDYAGKVGDGSSSSVVMAVALWIARNFPDAPLQVIRTKSDGAVEVIGEHPVTQLLRRPNPYYSGVVLWMAVLVDFTVRGNAYLWKIKSGAGRVVQLWYIPGSLIEPRWEQNQTDQYITHYAYRYDGSKEPLKIPPEDVIHFRFGLDPLNTRKGLSPLASLLREIYTDDQAANWVSSLLRNSAGPSVIITPDADSGVIEPEEAEQIKASFITKFGGDNRGEPMVSSSKVKVTPFSFSPEQMAVREQRRIPEERVTAVTGIPAVVVGLGAGLDRSTFANMAEAREAAYENGIIPLQRIIIEDLTVQLLEDFADTTVYGLRFDNSQVRILQEDLNKLWARVGQAVSVHGLLTVGEGLTLLGQDAGPEHDYYLRPGTLRAVPRAEAGLAPAPVPLALQPAVDDGQPIRDLVAAALRDTGVVKTVGANGHGG